MHSLRVIIHFSSVPMSRLFRKTVLLLVFTIAVLQIIHMSLMSKLEAEKRKQSENKQVNKQQTVSVDANLTTAKYNQIEIDNERRFMHESIRSLSSVLDSSGEYRIISFLSTSNVLKDWRWKYSVLSKIETLDGITSSTNLYRPNDVSLVSHSTPSQLHNLDLLTQRWQGLVSVSVFVTSIEQLPMAVEIILLLRYCRAAIRDKTSFHLVYPLSLSAKLNRPQESTILAWSHENESQHFIHDRNCQNLESSISALFVRKQNYDHVVAYPNNLLRNIGRRYALTEYTFVIDIDLVPSARLYEHFLEFGKKTRLFKQAGDHLDEDRIVFVVPSFEMDRSNVTKNVFPGDKQALTQYIQAKLIRPFYIELCWKCQKHTDYEAWLHSTSFTNNSNDNAIDILFEVLWKDPWEPFYISKNTVPFYDERFQQYGFNRISQVCELNMAGYRFAVLNNAFLVHDGFKQPNSFHATKDVELEHNRMLFRQFKLQLKHKYPKSNRRC